MALVEFLRARLDEDEAAANAAPGSTWTTFSQSDIAGASVYDEQWRLLSPAHYDHDNALGAKRGPRYIEDARDQLVAHIARHDPARVLAEVEAKRRILDEHTKDSICVDGRECCKRCVVDIEIAWDEAFAAMEPIPCPTVRLLALPYAEHPDYRQEWRP
jgi:hypothetical protein